MSYKSLIRGKLNKISDFTGENYGLDYNRETCDYMFWVNAPLLSYKCHSSHLEYSMRRMSGRELYNYLDGVITGYITCLSITYEKLKRLRFCGIIDNKTCMMLDKKLL